MTGHVFALAMAALDEANGPEGRPRKQDAPAEWDKIDWRAQEGQVRRLRQRIFKVAREHFNPQRPRGLLEPCAAMSGTHGSKGAPAQQCAGATRLGAQAESHERCGERTERSLFVVKSLSGFSLPPVPDG
jgi:hypothetical protein